MLKAIAGFSCLAMSFIVTACCTTTLEADYRVIPLPEKIEIRSGSDFTLNSSTVIYTPDGNERLAQTAAFLSSYINELTGLQPEIYTSLPDDNYIALGTDPSLPMKAESYVLDITPKGITLTGKDDAGVFYGAQTLRKSLPVSDGQYHVSMPSGRITDSPRFGYRGLHLDVARHMYPVEFIKKYIDLMALHNINTLHWHLTDDQGWRIEIKKYPRLAEISSMRKETLTTHWELPDHKYDGTPYGGYYTQDEIRDIVAYAAARHIDIMPEIDLPGHMLAVLAAYPELGCTGGPYEVGTHWGVYDDVLCAGNEKSYEFLENIFAEIVQLFPYKYIHLGGDECPKVRWKACPKCQKMIRKHHLHRSGHTPEEALQAYMMGRIGDYLKAHGKSIMGWDEILSGGIKNATIMSWRGEKGCIEAVNNNLPAVLCPYSHLYLDFAQSRSKKEPLTIGGYTPVEKVYSYNPMPAEIAGDAAKCKLVLGVQGNVWTEYLKTEKMVEYMTIPRIDALTELQWTSAEKDYPAFLKRLERMCKIYDKLGYHYARHAFDPEEQAQAHAHVEELAKAK